MTQRTGLSAAASCRKRPSVPSREQFQNIVFAIRSESQGKGKNGADLVQLLAYSGMRLNEARSLRWRDVNFARGVFTVTGGERGTKNYEQRTMPLSDELRDLLNGLKRERGKVAPDAFVIKTTSARKCMETACRNLGLPNFHHHSLRHYFATCAIESGVDIPDRRALAWPQRRRRATDENLFAFAASAQLGANQAREFWRDAAEVKSVILADSHSL